jgi:hypothetical protein
VGAKVGGGVVGIMMGGVGAGVTGIGVVTGAGVVVGPGVGPGEGGKVVSGGVGSSVGGRVVGSGAGFGDADFGGVGAGVGASVGAFVGGRVLMDMSPLAKNRSKSSISSCFFSFDESSKLTSLFSMPSSCGRSFRRPSKAFFADTTSDAAKTTKRERDRFMTNIFKIKLLLQSKRQEDAVRAKL